MRRLRSSSENTDTILQVNEGKYEFTLGGEDQDNDADENTIILRVQIPNISIRLW